MVGCARTFVAAADSASRGLSECSAAAVLFVAITNLKVRYLPFGLSRKPSVYPDHFFAGGDSVLDFREEEEALDLKK